MGRAFMSRSVLGRLASGALLLLAVMPVPVATQVPGQNVNMISVDKYLQKQNEVDLTISPVNPCHIVGAANDYRSVNNKGLNTDGEIGDSWVGVYVSTDCGDTWLNYLMPGYGQAYTTAADPIARFGPGGGLYISHIQFNRGTNWGRVAVARYFDFNDFEGVPASTYNETSDKDWSDPYASPVGYLGTTEVARGSAGQFLDKPALAVVPGTGQACAVTGGRTIPPTDVLVSWTEFLSKSDQVLRTKVYFARYTNCGTTLAAPANKLSEGYPVNQGSVIAVNPADPNIVYVAWRQVATDKTVDAIIFVKSTDGGKTFTKPTPVPYFDGVARQLIASNGTLVPYQPFDQPTTSTTFRTLGYPAMVVDEAGRAYLVVSARVGPSTPGKLPTDSATPGADVNLPEARILVTSTADGVFWETPNLVDSGPAGWPAGHQFMPALAYAGGRLNLTWYDLRYDESNVFKAFADEKDAILGGIRHTLDVRGAQVAVPPPGTWTWPLNFQVYGVSDIGDDKEKISLYYAQNGTPPGVQLNFNPANLKLYAGGTMPFMGDYIGTAGLQYVPNGPGQWKFNDATAALNNTVLRTFHTAWTDNRDAIVGAAGYPGQPAKNPNLDYVAPGTGSSCEIGTTEFAKANSRNANIYTSRITPGLFLSALGNTKPGITIERAFAVQVENGTASQMVVHLSIGDGQTASFTQPASTGTRALSLTIGPFSSTARTVYVAQASPTSPRIDVVAQQKIGVSNGPLRAAIVLNGDPVLALVQPLNESDSVADKDTHNPRVENPRVENPRVENSSVKNPRVENPRVENPRVENPRVENTTVETPRVENPRVENPRVENAPYSDITYEVTNDGNTTSAFDLDLRTSMPTAGYEFQLIAWRGYKLPYVGADCKLTYREDPQVLINEPLLPGEFGYLGLPPDKRASVVIRPGETISWTLRAYDIDGGFTPFCTDPVEAPGVNDCNHTLTADVGAQAINTGEAAPSTDTTRGGGSGFSILDPLLPLTPAAQGSPYSVQFNVSGGTELITWSSVDLPSGLSVSSAGLVSGTPTVFGTYTFGLTATDSSAPEPLTDSRTFSITIAPQLLITTPSSLPDALVGFPYAQTLAATGGTGPYTWTVLTSSLAPGLGWATGVISGIPTVRMPSSIKVLVTDSGPPVQTVEQTFTIPMPAVSLTYVVDTTADSGPGSLRQAMTYANANTLALDTITFSIPTPPYTISPSTALPVIVDPVTINGTTQLGYAGTPIVELSGSATIDEGLSIGVAGSNSTVRGLVLNGFGYGITINGATGTTVGGNHIGTNAAGTTRVPNSLGGIFVWNATDTTITENLISGQGTIGSSSRSDGMQVSNSTGTRLLGNRIGTNAAASAAVGNAGYGVVITGSGTVGTELTGNVISGNAFGGVVIQSGANGTSLQSNKIGTGASTAVEIGNGGSGVDIFDSPDNVLGSESGLGMNSIAHNTSYGVFQYGAASTGNWILGNEIWHNGNMGINLNGWDGVTANDVPDVNGIQNFPVITSAYAIGGTTVVGGTLTSTPGNGVRVEIFSNDSCDWSGGYGEGAHLVGSFLVIPNLDGSATFSQTFPSTPVGSVLTATSSRWIAGGSTSEFSACYTIPTPTNPGVTAWAGPSAATAGSAFLILATVTPGTNPASTGLTVTADLSTIGGPASVSINDLGMMYGCDDIGGDGTYVGCGTVGASTLPGAYTIPVTITDSQGRTSSTSFPFTVLGSGTGNFTATVHDGTGGVIPGAQVTVTSVPPGSTRAAMTDTGGSAAFAGLQAGTWNVTVDTIPPRSYGTTQFQISGGQNLSLNIYPQAAPAAPTGLTIYDGSGTVVTGGVPVTVTDLSTGISTTYNTDSSGQISLPLGVYDVRVGTFQSRIRLDGVVTNFMILR